MSGPHLDKLLRKLRSIASLSAEDERAVMALPVTIARFEPQRDIVREGDRPSRSFLLASGFAVGSKVLSNGHRQITSLYVSGDVPDLQSLHLDIMDMSVIALVPCEVAFIEHSALRRLCEAHTRLSFALWRSTLIDAAIYREWIANVGQRPAVDRAAHLICEVMTRVRALGLATGHTTEFPLTQSELADALRMSTVHVSRVVRDLRAARLVEFKDKRLHVLDWDGLRELAGFDPTYLHLRELAPAE